MEIAAILIAVVGLLALSSGGMGVRLPGIGTTPPPTPPPEQPPTPWTPTAASPYPVPMVPSQTSNVDGQIFSGVGAVGTSVATQAIKSSGASGIAGTAATVGVAAGVGIVVGIITSLLSAHKARMQGAKNENQAVDQYVPIFDSFVKQLVAAYNSKQGTAAQVATAAQQMDQFIYQKFRSFVGQPGTAWDDTQGMAGKCNKSCTVGCCVYFGDLGPVLNNISYVLGFPTGKWGAGDPRISGRTITVPKVYPSKYSSYSRELYTITLR